MTDPTPLAWLRERVEAMTPGPWEQGWNTHRPHSIYSPPGGRVAVLHERDDKEAIAHLRNVAPELLALCEAVDRSMEDKFAVVPNSVQKAKHALDAAVRKEMG